MDDADLRLDGNAAAGLLGEIFRFEMTMVWAECAGCGAAGELGALEAYVHGMGTVLRCPSCQTAVLRLAQGEGRYWLDLRGAAVLQLDAEPAAER